MQSVKPNKFIVLEGISGSGKTEIGTRLAEYISARYYTTPSTLFRQIREKADKSLCLEARFLFYLSSVVQASWEISKILETQSVVCDKYIWSTICYHSVYGLKVKLPPLNTYRQPNYVFLIVCDEEKRLKRLRCGRGIVRDSRNKERYDRRQEMERRCLIEFRKYIQLEIDNTLDGSHHAIDQILANMK
jgi:thymidylate kinase